MLLWVAGPQLWSRALRASMRRGSLLADQYRHRQWRALLLPAAIRDGIAGGEPQVGQAACGGGERSTHGEARDRRADADMHAEAEGQVADHLAADIEVEGIVIDTR